LKVLYASLFIVIIDQVSKLLVKGGTIPILGIHIDGMRYAESVRVFGDYVRVTFVENPGMAFGIEVGESSKLFLSLFSLIASIGIIVYLFKVKNQKLIVRLSFAFILGGAVGNLIDRTFYGLFYNYAPVFYGRVVDFIHVNFFDFTLFGHRFNSFPIFNVADSAVTIGVIILMIFHRSIEPEAAKETETEAVTADAGSTSDITPEISGSKEEDKPATPDVEDNIRKKF
jgi:signal peptidase II